MVFKLAREAEKRRRKLHVHHLIWNVIDCVIFEDDIEKEAA